MDTLSALQRLMIHVVQPMLIPCYLFLLMAPSRIHTLRNVGIQGRAFNSNLLMPFEGFKRILIAVLMALSLSSLFSSSSGDAELVEPDVDQIDSTSHGLPASAQRFHAVVELISYASALCMSFMQERRQFVDAWYCQPLLWAGQLLVGLSGLQLQAVEYGPVAQTDVQFPAMLAFLCLVTISGHQMYTQREQSKRLGLKISGRHGYGNRGGAGAPGSHDIEFQVDQQSVVPFLSRFSRGGRRNNQGPNNGDDDSDESPRGFNNPNLQLSVRFKNKVRNNNFEFIVTVEPEDAAQGDGDARPDGGSASALSESLDSIPEKNTTTIKQYKVKRNLYEFQELFNYFDGKNPGDENLRQFDYNRMFQTFGGKLDESQNIHLLEDFLACLCSIKQKQPDGKMYLVDERLQEFINMDDASIRKRLHLMSLSDFGGGGMFGQLDQPVSKVYTTLNIIDGYQQRKKDGPASRFEEEKEECEPSESGILDSLASTKYINEQNPLSPVRPFNSFTVKAIEFGRANTKFDMEYRSHVWLISKNQELVDQYLGSIGLAILSHLNTDDGVNPRFTTLLFFDFFKKIDQMSAVDTFRSLNLKIEQIEVFGTSLRIDSKTGKTVIDLDFCFTFGQTLGVGESAQKIQERVAFRKTHKQLKALSKEVELEMKSIKYLDRENQMQHVEAQLCKLYTSSFQDRNSLIEFLTQDFYLYVDEQELLGGGPEGFAKQRASKEQAYSSEDEPNFVMSESAEKGFGKLMAGLIGDNPLKGMPFLNRDHQQPSDQSNQKQNIASSTAMDFDEHPSEKAGETSPTFEKSNFGADVDGQPLRMTGSPPGDLENPYLTRSPPPEKEAVAQAEKFDVEEPDKAKEENFGQKTVKVAGEVKDAVIKNQLVQSISKGVFNLVVSSRQQERERKGEKALMENDEYEAQYREAGKAATEQEGEQESPFAYL